MSGVLARQLLNLGAVNRLSGGLSISHGTSLEGALTAASTGETILLPPGTYTLTGDVTLPAGVSLIGFGPHQTVISCAQQDFNIGGQQLIADVQFLAGSVLGSGVNNVDFRGVLFDGTGNAASSDNVAISNDSYDVRFSGCTSQNATQDNFSSIDNNRVSFTGGCRSIGATRDNFHLERHSSGTATPSSSDRWQTVIVNDFYSVGAGRYGLYDLASHDIRVANGVVENSTVSGVVFDTPVQVGFSNNIIERNSTGQTGEAELVLLLGDVSAEGSNYGQFIATGNDIGGNLDNKRTVFIDGQHASDYLLKFTGGFIHNNSTTAFASLFTFNTNYRSNYDVQCNGVAFRMGSSVLSTAKGVFLAAAVGTDEDAQGVSFRGCTFDGCPLVADIVRTSDSLWEGNAFENNTKCFDLRLSAATEAKIHRNRFRDNSAIITTSDGATYVANDNDGLADNP